MNKLNLRQIIPSKRVREEFRLTYELKGAQKAVNFLARHYKIRSMRIIVNGRKAGNRNDAVYDNRVAYFKKKKINRVLVLHEFYHHLAYIKDWDISRRREEKEAERYAKAVQSRKLE